MRPVSSVVFVSIVMGLLCPTAYSAETSPPKEATSTNLSALSKALLSMEGPGGRVSLGDTLEQAKKAFPAPKGAQIMGASNYAIFGRPGWTWITEQPAQAFEINLKDDRIVGIIRTVVMPDQKSRQKLIEQTIGKLGKPTAQAAGKTATMYAWDAKPNARFLLVNSAGLLGGPMVMSIVGDQDDLKMFNYRVNEVHLTVKQLDLAAEAMKDFRKPRGNTKSQGSKQHP